MKIRIDGKDFRVAGQVIGNQIWLHFNGRTMVIDKDKKKINHGSNRENSRKQGITIAPMPGKVTKVFAKEDEYIQQGQALVVMEAMKMEYTLKSDSAGIIKSVKVQAGQQVTMGQLLIEVIVK